MNSVVPRMQAGAKRGESGRLGADHLTSERWGGGGGEFGIGMNFSFFFKPFRTQGIFFLKTCVTMNFFLYIITCTIFFLCVRGRVSTKRRRLWEVVAYEKWSQGREE